MVWIHILLKTLSHCQTSEFIPQEQSFCWYLHGHVHTNKWNVYIYLYICFYLFNYPNARWPNFKQPPNKTHLAKNNMYMSEPDTEPVQRHVIKEKFLLILYQDKTQVGVHVPLLISGTITTLIVCRLFVFKISFLIFPPLAAAIPHFSIVISQHMINWANHCVWYTALSEPLCNHVKWGALLCCCNWLTKKSHTWLLDSSSWGQSTVPFKQSPARHIAALDGLWLLYHNILIFAVVRLCDSKVFVYGTDCGFHFWC